MGVIYKITSPRGRFYVGKTKNLRKRKNDHKERPAKGASGILYNSIRKYGWDKHSFEIIEEVEDSLLNEREIYWIQELKSYYLDNPLGMNLTKGGEGNNGSWMHDVERRKKQSEKFKGNGNPFYGKKQSAEWRKEKSKEVSAYNKKIGKMVPKWGAEKGRQKIIRPVLCYSSNGVFISEYVSATDAADKLNVQRSSIVESCKGIISGVEGKYVFKYKIGNYPLKIDVGDIKTKTERRPIILMNEDYEPVIEFSGAEEAAEYLGIPRTTISRAAQYNYGKPIRTGHVFVYRDMYEESFREVI